VVRSVLEPSRGRDSGGPRVAPPLLVIQGMDEGLAVTSAAIVGTPAPATCLLQPSNRITRRRERAWRQPDVTGEHVTILATGKCVAACRRAVLRWARRGKICPLYQEGGARDVR
jgi:hypothetical protein